jgi:hypothetical protein
VAKKRNPVQEIKRVNVRTFNLQLFADGDPPPKSGGGYSAEYVQDLRNENASWRTKLRDAEGENEKLKTQLGEANKKVTDLEGQNKTFLESVCSVLGLDASKAKPEDVAAKVKEATSNSNVTVEKAQEALRKAAFIASAVKQGIRKEALEDAYKLADFSSVKVDLESMSVFQVDKDGKQIMKDNAPVAGLDSLTETLVKEKAYLLGKTGVVGSSSNPGGGGEAGNLTPEEEGKKLAEDRMKAKKAQASGGLDPWAKSS